MNEKNTNLESSSGKRKRGRPRKNQTVSVHTEKKGTALTQKTTAKEKSKNKKVSHENNEEIILHLPINMGDIEEICMSKKEVNNNIETNTVIDETTEKADGNKNSSSSIQDTNIFTIADMSYDSTSSDSTDDEHIIDLKNKIREQEELIDKLEAKLKECNNIINEQLYAGVLDKKVVEMDIKFVNIKDGKQIVSDKTDVACWWCTYNFDTMPCYIPEKYNDGKYYVFGCFCSFNCAAAFNSDIDDYKVSERYSLIKKLYNTIYDTNEDIHIADDKRVLQKFGGPVSIKNYRKNIKYLNKEYRVIMPPMISMVPLVEQNYKDNYNTSGARFQNSTDNLVLKRSKPLPNTRNTLMDTMGIFAKKNRKK